MNIYIKLLSIIKMLELYESHEYINKYLSQDPVTPSKWFIDKNASIPDIERILISNSIKYTLKEE